MTVQVASSRQLPRVTQRNDESDKERGNGSRALSSYVCLACLTFEDFRSIRGNGGGAGSRLG
jgi:hypothetical protein